MTEQERLGKLYTAYDRGIITYTELWALALKPYGWNY